VAKLRRPFNRAVTLITPVLVMAASQFAEVWHGLRYPAKTPPISSRPRPPPSSLIRAKIEVLLITLDLCAGYGTDQAGSVRQSGPGRRSRSWPVVDRIVASGLRPPSDDAGDVLRRW
jgi:hypothetical protein